MKISLIQDPVAIRQMVTKASTFAGAAPSLSSEAFEPYLNTSKSLYEYVKPGDPSTYIGDAGGLFSFDENSVVPVCFHFVCGPSSVIDVTVYDPDGTSYGRKILSAVSGVSNIHYLPWDAGEIYILRNQQIKVVETTPGTPAGSTPKMITFYVVKRRNY